MKPSLVGLVSGLVFGSGLVISGMSNAENVKAFLRLGKGWSPNLLGVMAAAIVVHRGLIALSTYLKPNRPIAAGNSGAIDSKLLAGSVLFGLGWGLAGYCPGPAIVAAAAAVPQALWFSAWMLGGIALFQFTRSFIEQPSSLESSK
jgi:uncharacterized protein